jgi:hypothetical protein
MQWIWNKKKSIRDSNVISSRQLGGACRRKRLEWEVPVEKDVLIELRHRESRQITGLLRQWTFGWAYKDNNPPTHLRAHRVVESAQKRPYLSGIMGSERG